jgi:hypothetical protein
MEVFGLVFGQHNSLAEVLQPVTLLCLYPGRRTGPGSALGIGWAFSLGVDVSVVDDYDRAVKPGVVGASLVRGCTWWRNSGSCQR